MDMVSAYARPLAASRRVSPPLLVALLLALPACDHPGPARLLAEPDPDRTGEDGELGPHGVGRERAMATVRGDESLRYTVYWPAESDLAPAGGPVPLVTLLTPSFATPDQLAWLTEWLGSTGHAVLVPRAQLDVTSGQETNADLAVEALRQRADDPDDLLFGLVDETPGVLLGHGTGGTVALNRWVRRPDLWEGVAPIAAVAERRQNLESGEGRPSLFVVGSDDGIVTPSAVRASQRSAPDPSHVAIISGMAYYDWLDDVSPGQRSLEPPASNPRETSRARAEQLFAAWVGDVLGKEAPLVFRDLDGVDVQ